MHFLSETNGENLSKLSFGIKNILHSGKQCVDSADAIQNFLAQNCLRDLRIKADMFNPSLSNELNKNSKWNAASFFGTNIENNQNNEITVSRLNSIKNRMEKRIGHPYQSRMPARHKKPRTSFSKIQVNILEKKFNEQKYLASADRQILASELCMSDAQVKTWFQNRRTKWRRQETEEREFEGKTVAKIFSLASNIMLMNSQNVAN